MRFDGIYNGKEAEVVMGGVSIYIYIYIWTRTLRQYNLIGYEHTLIPYMHVDMQAYMHA